VTPEPVADVVSAGQRLNRKVLLALILSGLLPLMVLSYVVHAYVVPSLERVNGPALYGVVGLVVFSVLAMVAGAWIIWDLGRSVATMARMLGSREVVEGLHRTDEVGTLMQSFTRMLSTIEHQAHEITGFAARLDSAYKELETANTRLKETTFRDEVTGLYNRRFFTLRLEEELSRFRRFSHPVAVVILDLDGFKAINDEHGHAAGDQTLREVGAILMKHSRGINVVSRYGGDEFAILLVETPKTGARLYAERMRDMIQGSRFPHGQAVTASFGVASLPDDAATSGDELFRAADEALYAAKRGGRNQVAVAGMTEPAAAAPLAIQAG
jgi:diguanylate cyclase (GGDEF)-like protein